LPQLIEPTLNDTCQPIDNIFADAWRSLKIGACAGAAKITKRSGCDAQVIIHMLLLWRWLGSSSVSMFCKSHIESFCSSKKDVLYDFMKRDDIN